MSGPGSVASKQYAKVKRTMPKTVVSQTWAPAGMLKIYQDPKAKKEKKMGWFKRKFLQWSREAWEHSRYDETAKTSANESVNAKTSVRFTIYPASGGHVIEHYKQDRYRDSEGPELTIVQNGESLGNAVEHILTMEALKS